MPSIAGRMEIFDDAQTLARRAADWFVDKTNATPGTVRVALSGGSTPKALYTLLGSTPFLERIPWQRLELFWGDERFVPHDDPASNYRMVRESLLQHAPIAAERVHPVSDRGTPEQAAANYETLLKKAYGGERLNPAQPLFAIQLLGLGSDGHTASLIPGQPVLEETNRWVAAVDAGRAEPRVTLTYPAIESSQTIVFLVTGSEKAAALKTARAGNQALPAARIQPQGAVIWFVDRAAAGAG